MIHEESRLNRASINPAASDAETLCRSATFVTFVGLIEEKIRSKLFVLVAGKISLNDEITFES